MTPSVLFQGDDWRIVRVQIDSKRRENEDDDGIRDYIEFIDGVDLMGDARWRQMDGKNAGVSDLVRVVHALKREFVNRLEAEREH